MGNINFRNEEEKVQENAGSIFIDGMPQEKADSYVGAIQQPTGYVGGFFGTNGNTEEQNAGSYVGGFVSNQTNQAQGVGYESISTTDEYDSKELSPKEEKVLNEVHDFLFQEVSFKGFKRSLKNNK